MYRYCFLGWLLVASGAYAQQPVLQWVSPFVTSPPAENGYSLGSEIVVDKLGYVYTAGKFEGNIDFDPGPGEYILSTFSESGVFITKLSPTGNFVWAKKFDLYAVHGIGLEIDSFSNVYLTSDIANPVDMDPGPGEYIPAMTFNEAFVLKLDSAGNFIWEKQLGGAGTWDVASGYSIALSKTGDLVIGGHFSGTVDFDPGTGYYPLTSSYNDEMFFIKMTTAGNLVWVRKGGHAAEMKLDQHDCIYTTGSFSGTIDFDPGPGVFYLTSNGFSDGFISRFDSAGNYLWTTKIGNSVPGEETYTQAMAIDGQHNIYSAGQYSGIQDFDPGSGVNNLQSNGDWDNYIVKLDSLGNFIWAKSMGSNSKDVCRDVKLDQFENPMMIGWYPGITDVDPGPGSILLNDPSAVLLKLDKNGNFIFAAPFSGILNGSSHGVQLATDNMHHIYMTGRFSGSVDFDPGLGTTILNHPLGIIVLKLSNCFSSTSSTLNIDACQIYTLNNQTYDSSGIYVQTIPNSIGCDSVITLNLTLSKKLTAQTQAICEGKSFFVGGANQTMAGEYIDTLQTLLGCDSIVTTTLIVHSKPAPELGTDKSLCNDSTLYLTPGNFSEYQWQDMTTSSSYLVNTPGMYWVKVTTDDGCAATDSVTITGVQGPGKFLKSEDSVCNNSIVKIQPTGLYQQYEWSTGSTENNISISTPGNYWLRVTDVNGCSGINMINIITKDCNTGFFIPTAFTPDGNGRNDGFRPLLFGNVKQYRFSVYNRWGELVFHSTEQQRGWDGKISGFLQTTGIFVWTCLYRLEGENEKLEKGTVLLIR